MPFPLAHPAAVLPLRRYCPRYLNLPALVIGSLSPDIGYCFGPLQLGGFSHRFLAGSFGFCVPVGLLVLSVFYLARLPVIGVLPARYREGLLPLCRRPLPPLFVIIASLVIGAWTHIFLDTFTHPDTWLVRHLPILQIRVASVGRYSFRLHELLYAGCTFSGVAWLALSYLRWLDKTVGTPSPGVSSPGVKWGSALLLAGSILWVALASRGEHQSVGTVPLGIITVLLVIGFLLATRRSFSQLPS